MTTRRGRGRRDNGLDATLWSPLRDVDPRVGEHLLDVLSAAGIAAYLEPSADVAPYTRTVYLPSPPSDRLFVDRARRTEARSLIEQQVGQDADPRGHRPATGSPEHPVPRASPRPPQPERGRLRPDLDEDAEWAAIVAAFEAEHGRTVAEPVDDAGNAAAAPDPRPAPPLPPPPHEPAILDRPDEHYEPPPPPPMPAPAPASLYATMLVAGGLFLIGAPSLLRLSTDLGLFLGVGAIAAGVAMFLSRMRDRSEDDDGDDGAVV